MKGCLYILESNDGKYYIGSSTNTRQRFKRHQSGYVHTTARMKNVRMVFRQEYKDITTARKVERWLKSLKRKDYITKIIKNGKIKKKF